MPDTTITEQLKAERIQATLRAELIQERLKAERIQAALSARRLSELLQAEPGWTAGADGRSLVRRYQFPTLRASALFVELVTEVGEAAGYVPNVDLRNLEVTLSISSNRDEGLTEIDFEIARLIDNRP